MNTSRTVSFVRVLSLHRMGHSNLPAAFRPWGQILTLLCTPLNVSQELLPFYFSLLHVCTCLFFNRASDAKGKPSLRKSVLECLFLHSFSSLTANLHLNCIYVVHRHARSEVFCVIRSATKHLFSLVSDTWCFLWSFGGNFSKFWILERLDKIIFICDVALSLFKSV